MNKLTPDERKIIRDEKKKIKASSIIVKTNYRYWLTWRLIEIIERLSK